MNGQKYTVEKLNGPEIRTSSVTLKGMANAKQTIQSVINNWPRDSRGWFSHYTNPGDWPSGAENSTIDTSIMISGAIFAGNYFGGEVKTLAETLKNIPDWSTAGKFSNRVFRLSISVNFELGLFLTKAISFDPSRKLFKSVSKQQVRSAPIFGWFQTMMEWLLQLNHSMNTC